MDLHRRGNEMSEENEIDFAYASPEETLTVTHFKLNEAKAYLYFDISENGEDAGFVMQLGQADEVDMVNMYDMLKSVKISMETVLESVIDERKKEVVDILENAEEHTKDEILAAALMLL